MVFQSRLATHHDLVVLGPLVESSIDELQRGFLDEAQIRSSHSIMGIDRQLIDDGTYFVVELDGLVVGCGGWSRRATLYGGDHSAGRNAAFLDPAVDAARVRGMYTRPGFTRRGVGRLVLSLCEEAAAREGFTLAGLSLYQSAGFVPVAELEEPAGGVPVPLVKMRKPIES